MVPVGAGFEPARIPVRPIPSYTRRAKSSSVFANRNHPYGVKKNASAEIR